jgi:signal transduction histidine kinase/CheY-like chemotaxis protein
LDRRRHEARLEDDLSGAAFKMSLRARRARLGGLAHTSSKSRIVVCGILYHQYVNSGLKGALLTFKPYISWRMNRVAPFIGLRGSLANNQTARMLHLLLAALAVWIAAAWAAATPFAQVRFSFPRIFYPLLLEVSYATALVMLRLGHFQRASLAYLAGTWIWATLVSYSFGGVHSPGVLLYVSLPASAAWLLGHKGAIRTAVGCLLSALVFTVLEMTHVSLPLQAKATSLGIWAVIVQATLINAIPVGQIIGRLRETLKELQRHRQHLESLVEQRTHELVQARDLAESANRAKSAFLANMSHELRTPLSVILASSSLLSESDPTADQIEDISAIGRSGEHLLGLIDDVLDVARIEAGKEELAIAATDLISTVRTVVEMMRGRSEEKHLALVYRQDSKVPRYVRVDAPKLRQILINLIGNAIKFTKEGTIKLRLSAQPVDEPGRARFCFDIEDSGVGMPQHDLVRIFEPFEQVRNPGPQAGTGLGLTITRRFVELMGGTLHVESKVGRGSRFVVELTLELARESETYGVEMASGHLFILEPGQPEWRVLIIEDDSESATVLRKMLARAGFKVRVAENGALGIEAFQQWRPHFIWMDLGLPQLRGMEATRRIRQLDGGAKVKIAAITAYAYASGCDGVIEAGFDDLTFKPFRQKNIFLCLARHLGVRYSSSDGAGNKSHRQAGARSV